MYDELIEALRNCTNPNKYCEDCGFFDKCCLSKEHFSIEEQAADAIEELQRQIDAWVEPERKALIKSLPQWIPVTERLPEESGHYLIYVVGGEFKQWSMVTMAYYHKKFYYDDMEDNFDQITHWMPIPEPPESEGE